MNEEARKIFEESIRKQKEIIAEAKTNGAWKMGLDSNKELFAELNKETMSKLKALEERLNK